MQRNLNKINQIIQQLESTDNLLDFETVELPFELLKAVVALLESTFSPEALQKEVADNAETIDAWAIAFHQSLTYQLTVINTWRQQLSQLPLPPKLIEKIEDKVRQIYQIHQEEALLLGQEITLRQRAKELDELRQKVTELASIEQEVNSVDLEQLKTEIEQRTVNIQPQYQQLQDLKQQKSALEDLLKYLEDLKMDIEGLQLRQSKLEQRIIKSTSEIITELKTKNQDLQARLLPILTDLEIAEQEFVQTKQTLEKAVADFNQYQIVTQERQYHLKTHYQHNEELAGLLPVDCKVIERLTQEIKELLAKMDQELTRAQKQHELSKQKLNITF